MKGARKKKFLTVKGRGYQLTQYRKRLSSFDKGSTESSYKGKRITV